MAQFIETNSWKNFTWDVIGKSVSKIGVVRFNEKSNLFSFKPLDQSKVEGGFTISPETLREIADFVDETNAKFIPEI